MRTGFIRLALLAVAIAAATGSPRAQERRQGGSMPYDLSKEQTFAAEVKSVEKFMLTDDQADPMLYLAVTVEAKTWHVFLGPQSWVAKQAFTFAPGSKVEIRGVAGYRLNGDAIMPRTIKTGAKTLTLRDAQGKSLWEDR